MANIQLLDQDTINQIAAGEVIERPASVVKELLENAIDARATAVTVEIRDGGLSFIRVTDNGCGIPMEELPVAFLRHATSKIRTVEDLFTVASLGFRGEALSSIAAVGKVELITRTGSSMAGARYVIEGGEEKSLEEIGAPEGTTFIVRDLFYNTPARRKFLKTPATEGSHVADLVEKLALSHPEVSIRFIQNNQSKLHTSGNHNLKDIVYAVYGREIAANLLPVDAGNGLTQIGGFIGKPLIARGNRNFESYFINGRYIKSGLVNKAIEDAYKPYMMQHKYPFTMLQLTIDPAFLDVNVHPAKMELRFRDGEQIYKLVYHTLSMALSGRELIPEVELADAGHSDAFLPGGTESTRTESTDSSQLLGVGWNGRKGSLKPVRPREQRPEPFETRRREQLGWTPQGQKKDTVPAAEESTPYGTKPVSAACSGETVREELAGYGAADSADSADPAVVPGAPDMPEEAKGTTISDAAEEAKRKAVSDLTEDEAGASGTTPENALSRTDVRPDSQPAARADSQPDVRPNSQPDISRGKIRQDTPRQLDFFEEKLLTRQARAEHRLIGQLFDTYWLVQFHENLYIIDQHAAHEKVLYEKTMRSLKNREYTSQLLNPPIILTLSDGEAQLLTRYMEQFTAIGFEIEPFGGKEYAVRGVPANLFSIAKKELLLDMLDSLSEETGRSTPDLITERIASMSCKAAVKGNHAMSAAEADRLIDELLELENPYACPHGRPTIISMSKYELEKKFKRIV